MSTSEAVPESSIPHKITEIGRYNIPLDRNNSMSPSYQEYQPLETQTGQPRGPQPPGLNVERVDTLDARNRAEHRTNLFEDQILAVRRGQMFWVDIFFSQDVSSLENFFYLKFEIGANPRKSMGTRIVLPSKQMTEWVMQVEQSSGHKVSVSVTPPPDCIVGKFQMIVGVLGYSRIDWIASTIKEVYILFNPWIKSDVVHMPFEEERQEYVLNQHGILYNGDPNSPVGRPWNYGQFQKGILDACLYIMDVAKMPIIDRGNAVKIIRMGSAMINSQDDHGVLVGNWSGQYGSETPPTAWTGSPEILDKYVRKSRPVAFAQCWVYAGVFNTFLRCLGIPSRVVSNFRSAHDNDGNLKIDVMLTDKLALDTENTRDSLWNYHCWNECFMVRSDLPVGFGGWQVVDSTPQETSDGMFRCGPASVIAIKHGLICYPFDARFVYAEVNGDIVFYLRNWNGSLEKVFVDRSTVGKMVLTKAIGQNAMSDITNEYKFPEGTLEERMALKNAEQYGCIRDGTVFPHVDVGLAVLVSSVRLSDDFQVTVELKNMSGERRTVDLYVSGNVVFYTGVHSSQFKFQILKGVLDPWRTETATVHIHAHEYMSKLVEQAMLHFIIIGRVNETERILTTTRVVALQTPEIIITVSGSPVVGQSLTITVEFTNTAQTDLTDVVLRLELTGLVMFGPKKYSIITRGSTVKWSETFVPQRPMWTVAIASLSCVVLRNVVGQKEINITY